MRQEPPVLSQPAPDARPGAAGPVAMAENRSSSFGQDHAPGGGMSMILTKAIFITLGIATGASGVVACFGSIEGVMIGIPLILLGFGCALFIAFSKDFGSVPAIDATTVRLRHYVGDTNDSNFIATGELREIDQITRGEGRFADLP